MNHSEAAVHSIPPTVGVIVTVPMRVTVQSVGSCRYDSAGAQAQIATSQWHIPTLHRPLKWEDRISGIDCVSIKGGGDIRLASNGMQSVPRPGWVLLLTGGDQTNGFTWTLYGITKF